MMAHSQSWSTAFDEPLRRPQYLDQLSHSQSQAQSPMVEDDDLFSVALLFLDHHDESALSDCSDSFSAQSPDEMFVDRAQWIPAKSFQDQLAEVALQPPLKLQEPTQSPSIFVDTTASLALDAINAQAWSMSPSKPSSPPRRINKRRLEVERLRVESQTLQKRLSNLQDPSNEPTSSDATSGSVNNRLVGEVLGSAWQNIAARQLEQRERSETENRRLKNLVNEHKRMAKALRRLVARHANAKACDPLRRPTLAPASSIQARAGSFDVMDDPAVYQELRETLTTMYKQTDAMLANPKLASTAEASFSDMASEVDGDHAMRIQVLGARTLPFSFVSTCEAAWDYTFHYSEPNVLQWEPTESRDSTTFQTDFVAYTDLYHFKGLGRAKMMLRRIDEPHRVVILRSALFQCPGRDDDISCMRRPLRHCLWKIIQKPLTAADTKVCQLVNCELFMSTLELEGLDAAAQQHEIETLTTMCTQISAFHAKQANEFIDHSLLQRAIESPSPRAVEALASHGLSTAVPKVYS